MAAAEATPAPIQIVRAVTNMASSLINLGSAYRMNFTLDLPVAEPQLRILQPMKISSGWRIIQPISLHVEKEDDGTYVVSDGPFAVYGEGETVSDAMSDYVVSLMDYFELLEARCSGSRPTAQLLQHVRQYVLRESN